MSSSLRLLRNFCGLAGEFRQPKDRLRGGDHSESGADSRIRTDDLIITNDLLYQLSYIGILSLFLFQEQDSGTRELKNPGMGKTALDRGFFSSARVRVPEHLTPPLIARENSFVKCVCRR